MYNENDKRFAAELLEKLSKKLIAIAPKVGADFPYTDSKTGIFHAKDGSPVTWTSGYWPGMMWLMYIKTGDEMFRKIAEECEEKMDVLFDEFTPLHHDVGFMWELTAVADFKLTGNERSRVRASHAAAVLASRYNPTAKIIRAWPWGPHNMAIVDCMMNIPILEWAAKYGAEPDSRFADIARIHADSVIDTFIREDGSVNHIVRYNRETGEVTETPGGQGYASGSSWSRGQAWAIYGFAAAYKNSGKKEYLNAAKRVANYFIANVEPGKLPLLDFRAPAEPVYYDASAAAITACGLIEIASAVDEFEAPMYERAAMDFLRTLESSCNFDEKVMYLLENSSGSYGNKNGIHCPWIFGDYYLLEALMKLYGNDGKFIIHND